MKYRFPACILILAISLGLFGYGLFGYRIRVYEKPAPEDAALGLPLKEEASFLVSETTLTEWLSKERILVHESGRLIDTAQEAECFS